MRTEYASGLSIEDEFGYSRAVRVGDTLYTSATAPVGPDFAVLGGDAHGQAAVALQRLSDLVVEAGFALTDVVHARVYLVDTGDLAAVGQAFREAFTPARPALTVVHVLPYSLSDLRLEIELTAHRAPRVA